MCPDQAPLGPSTLSLPSPSPPPGTQPSTPWWWRRATYRHFGPVTDLDTTRAVVESPERVSQHAFWPFVRYLKRTRKFDFRSGEIATKERPIQYPAHLDANIFAYYAGQLSGLYEERLDALGLAEVVTAYRPLQRNNVHFAAEAFAWVRDHAPCRIYCFDVAAFYDQLDHARLKAAWCDLIGAPRLPADQFAVFSALTRYAYVERDALPKALQDSATRHRRYCTATEFRHLRKRGELVVHRNPDPYGIPQGVALSGVLSNLYMLPFDHCLSAAISAQGGYYRRYSDDILIAVPAARATTCEVERLVGDALAERRLRLNPAKTARHEAVSRGTGGELRIAPPVTYLGLTYDGGRVLLRGATLARLHRRMTQAVSRSRRRTMDSGGSRQMPKGKLRRRFTHSGRRNFFSYVRPIESILREYGFAVPKSARRQLRRVPARLDHLMDDGD